MLGNEEKELSPEEKRRRDDWEKYKQTEAREKKRVEDAKRETARLKAERDEDKLRLDKALRGSVGGGETRVWNQSLGRFLAPSEQKEGVDLTNPERKVIGRRTDYNHK